MLTPLPPLFRTRELPALLPIEGRLEQVDKSNLSLELLNATRSRGKGRELVG